MEEKKIECAHRFFAQLSARNAGDVTYGVVATYADLMNLVTQP